MSLWQEVRCPGCDGFLFNFTGISAHFLIQIPCACGRWVGVKEGLISCIMKAQSISDGVTVYDPGNH